jgi:hypothetical protein
MPVPAFTNPRTVAFAVDRCGRPLYILFKSRFSDTVGLGLYPQEAQMSDRNTKLTWMLAVAFLIPALLSFAQAPDIGNPASFKIRVIRQQLVSAPDYRSVINGTGPRSNNLSDKWLRIETEFDSTPEWADDVQVKYYVLLGSGKDTRMFTGDVTYVNVEKGIRHVSAMFVHPNTVQRYGNGNMQAVAVQIFHKGQMIDQDSAPASHERWWENYTPVSGYLLTPQQTPWSIISYDRYEALKPTS